MKRLTTAEKAILTHIAAEAKIGNALKEIRDDELFKEDGFRSFDEYLKKRVLDDFGIDKKHAKKLVLQATIQGYLSELEPKAK